MTQVEKKERQAARNRASSLLNIPSSLVEDDLLDFMTERSRDAVVKARAGSGKTTALAMKVASLTQDYGVDPQSIVMLTFNNAAARNLETRLADLSAPSGVRVRTFHAFANRIVRAHFGNARQAVFDETGPDAIAIKTMMEASIREVLNDRFFIFCASRMRAHFGRQKDYVTGVGTDALLSAVGFLRTRGFGALNPMQNAWEEGGPIAGNAMKVVLSFEKKLREARMLDATAVLQAAAWTLEREIEQNKSRPSDAHGIQWLFIDEYQDVSQPYMRLVEAVRNINGGVVVQAVGDDWQAINGFAGADLTYFRHPGRYLDNPRNLTLLRNRRSGAAIVDWGNSVMRDAGHRDFPALSVPANGQGKINEMSLRGSGDIRMNAAKLQKAIDFDAKTVALISRKWKIKDHGLKELGNILRRGLKEAGFGGELTVITAHGSKGLEYDQVFLLDDGSFDTNHPSRPILQDLISEEDSMREENCLRYVAGTRAKQHLVLVDVT